MSLFYLFFCSGAFILEGKLPESSALAISNCALHCKQVALNTLQTHYLREGDEAAGRLLLLPRPLFHVLHSINSLSLSLVCFTCIHIIYSVIHKREKGVWVGNELLLKTC